MLSLNFCQSSLCFWVNLGLRSLSCCISNLYSSKSKTRYGSFWLVFIVGVCSFEVLKCSSPVAPHSWLYQGLFASDFWIHLCSIYSADKVLLHFLGKIVRKPPIFVHPVIEGLSANSSISTGICVTSSTAKSILEFSDNLLCEFARTPSFIFLLFFYFLTCISRWLLIFLFLTHFG